MKLKYMMAKDLRDHKAETVELECPFVPRIGDTVCLRANNFLPYEVWHVRINHNDDEVQIVICLKPSES